MAANVLIVYGTTEGHTRKIANWMAERLRADGFKSTVIDTADGPKDLAVDTYDAAIIAGSVHQGNHQKPLIHFVRERQAALDAMPTLFVSVSLSAVREEDHEDAQGCADTFLEETGWQPGRTELVAGALLYTKYDWFKRQLMKMIVGKGDGPTDTHRDYEFTDWEGLATALKDFAKAAA